MCLVANPVFLRRRAVFALLAVDDAGAQKHCFTQHYTVSFPNSVKISYVCQQEATECQRFIFTSFKHYAYVRSLQLLTSGDIHPNPGPTSRSDSLSLSTDSYMDLINSGISVMHLNIQSLKPKLDILAIEAQLYDILIFTETWLSPSTSDDDLHIINFSPPFRCDRQDRQGGGVAIYVREGLHATCRPDLAVNGLEALWVELHANQRKFIIGGIYRPPDSNNNQFLLMEESIDRVFDQVCDNVLVAGDFNINVLNSDSNKISRLITSYNAEQLITSPTHYTEHSNSLIDLIFVKDTHHVITSFVADPFIPDLVRYHCPVVAVLKINKPKAIAYKRKIWLYDQGNYEDFRLKLNSINWHDILQTENLDTTADIITNSIIDAASATIPNKVVTIRPNDIPWFNNNIRKLIRKRNRYHTKAKNTNPESNWANFRKIRNEVTKLIRKSKTDYDKQIIDKLNDTETSVKTCIGSNLQNNYGQKSQRQQSQPWSKMASKLLPTRKKQNY